MVVVHPKGRTPVSVTAEAGAGGEGTKGLNLSFCELLSSWNWVDRGAIFIAHKLLKASMR